MPFTVSHIAAVLPAGRFPLLRDPLILSAFVVGSMSPDVPYFVPLASWADTYGWSAASHTWAGVLSVNVPVTLALVALYWLVLAAPLRALAPHAIRARLPQHVMRPHLASPLRTAALLLLAAAVGSATHVVWDAFTHEGGFGVMAVPWLQPHLLGPLPAYRVLQYVSSVFGLAVICWSLLRWYRSTPASTEVPAGLGWRWQAVIAGGVVTAGALSWWSVRDLALGATDLYDVREMLTGGLTRSMAFMALVVLVGALAARVPMLRLETVGRS
jgi:hypothetical protein